MERNAKRSIVIGVIFLAAVMALSGMAFASSHPAETAPRYVALGDSVAAGSGFKGGDKPCDRSSLAYSFTVARALKMDGHNLACSGAKTDQGLYGGQKRAKQVVPEQLSRAFADGTPDLMTVTIGANDMHWIGLITQCYANECGNVADTARTRAYLADLRVELNWVLARIQQESDGHPPIVLMNGYYDPALDTACMARDHITADEATWLSAQTAALNDIIKEISARYPFASYVPIDFTGHGMCAAVPWIKNADEQGRFHPTVAGQQAIARANIAAYGRVVAAKPTAVQSLREKFLGWFGQ